MVLAALINAGAVQRYDFWLHWQRRTVTSEPLPLIEKMLSRRCGGCRLAREEKKALQDHVVRLYCERYTCREIADLTGLSYRYVRDSLKERGITPATRVGRGSRVGLLKQR
jgi:hypothetical protein